MTQLDHNRIVIRERGLLDLFDLALCVIRVCAGPLAITLLAGVLPAMLLNSWLLAGWVQPEPEEAIPWAYLWWMLLLVMWEAPVATALATLYLGEAMFLDRPRAGGIARVLGGAASQMFLYQVLLRAMCLPLVVTWFLPFAFWPYLNEVILLERNPLRRRRSGQITTYSRSKALHGGSFGDLFARWLVTVGTGAVLFVSLWCSMAYVAEMLFGEESGQELIYTLYYPLALWAVVGYFMVVRFLGYLDLRIRREGWEVELMMRAEGARLERQLT
jgi:hypothetical protein